MLVNAEDVVEGNTVVMGFRTPCFTSSVKVRDSCLYDVEVDL